MLMGSSIILLLVLQVFWLYNSYQKAFYDFRKDVEVTFRNTVMALRDSAFLQHIEKISPDSIYQSKSNIVCP